MADIETVVIPYNSEVLDLIVQLNNEPTLLMDQLTTGEWQCPVCQQYIKPTRQAFSRHFSFKHLDVYRPLFPITKDFYQPVWLKGSHVYYHKPSKRAICASTLTILARREIVSHLGGCNGCQSWKRPYVLPKDNQVLDKPLNVSRERNLPGGYFTAEGVQFRIHEPYRIPGPSLVRARHAPASNKPLDAEKWHRGNQSRTVRYQLGEVVKKKSSSAAATAKAAQLSNTLMTPSEEFAAYVSLFLRLVDLATLKCQNAVVERFNGPRIWVDDNCTQTGYWFGAANLNLPYPLADAVAVEAVLSNIECDDGFGLTTQDGGELRASICVVLQTLFKIVLAAHGKEEIIERLRIWYKNGVEDGEENVRDLQFNSQGKLVLKLDGKSYTMPWIVAELTARYLLILRPMVDKLYSDGPSGDYNDEELFVDATPGKGVITQLSRMCNLKNNLNGVANMKLAELARNIDYTQADPVIFVRGRWLVEYYEHD